MKIYNQVAAARPSLSDGALRIADFILEERERISEMSSTEVAERAAVSQSAVVKFVQKLGYSGMTAFRLAISAETARQETAQSMIANVPLHNEITSEDDPKTIAQKLMQEKVNALIETTREIDYKVLGRVIDRINSARLVQVTGIGGSFQVASDLAHKLLKMGIVALIDADSHVQLATANTLGPQDVQIAISYSGRKKEIVEAARVAKGRKARVVAITNPADNNPLAGLADLKLFTLADEARLRSSAISSRTAQCVVTDLIFMLLMQSEPQRNDMVAATNSLINRLAG
jgi:RpiR family transcriptional regulator, murPQ operon repressor